MSRLIKRDPFAREELYRESAFASSQGCDWCGGWGKKKRLYKYYTETDGGTRYYHKGTFCSVGCMVCSRTVSL